MSYRVYLTRPDGKNYQLFGNNDFPSRFYKYLKKYGCDMDEEGNFEDFEIINFHEFFGTIESYIQEEIKRSQISLLDAQNQYKNIINMNQRSRKNSEIELDMCNRPVTVGVYSFLENSYVFEGYRVLQFLEDYIKGGLDKTVSGLSFGREIQLKEGCKLYLSGR